MGFEARDLVKMLKEKGVTPNMLEQAITHAKNIEAKKKALEKDETVLAAMQQLDASLDANTIDAEAQKIADMFKGMTNEQLAALGLAADSLPKTNAELVATLQRVKQEGAEKLQNAKQQLKDLNDAREEEYKKVAASIKTYILNAISTHDFVVDGDTYALASSGARGYELKNASGVIKTYPKDELFKAYAFGQLQLVEKQAHPKYSEAVRKSFIQQIKNGSFTTTDKQVADDLATWSELAGYELKAEKGMGGVIDYRFEKKAKTETLEYALDLPLGKVGTSDYEVTPTAITYKGTQIAQLSDVAAQWTKLYAENELTGTYNDVARKFENVKNILGQKLPDMDKVAFVQMHEIAQSFEHKLKNRGKTIIEQDFNKRFYDSLNEAVRERGISGHRYGQEFKDYLSSGIEYNDLDVKLKGIKEQYVAEAQTLPFEIKIDNYLAYDKRLDDALQGLNANSPEQKETKGKIWYFPIPNADGSFPISVAQMSPEDESSIFYHGKALPNGRMEMTFANTKRALAAAYASPELILYNVFKILNAQPKECPSKITVTKPIIYKTENGKLVLESGGEMYWGDAPTVDEKKETIEPVEPPFTHKLYCKIPVNGGFNSIDARKASNGEQIFELLVQKEDHKAFLGISKDPSVQKYVFTDGNWEYYLNNPSVMLLNKPTSDTKKIQLVAYGEAQLVNGVWQVIKPVAVKFLGDGAGSKQSKEERRGIDADDPVDDIETQDADIKERPRPEAVVKTIEMIKKILEKREYLVPDTNIFIRLNPDGSYADSGTYQHLGGPWISNATLGDQAVENAKKELPKVQALYNKDKRALEILTSVLVDKIVLLAEKVGGLGKVEELLSSKYTYADRGVTVRLESMISHWLLGNQDKLEKIEQIIDTELALVDGKKEETADDLEAKKADIEKRRADALNSINLKDGKYIAITKDNKGKEYTTISKSMDLAKASINALFDNELKALGLPLENKEAVDEKITDVVKKILAANSKGIDITKLGIELGLPIPRRDAIVTQLEKAGIVEEVGDLLKITKNYSKNTDNINTYLKGIGAKLIEK